MSDDADWVTENLANSSQNIFYIGSRIKNYLTNETFSETDQVGTAYCIVFIQHQNYKKFNVKKAKLFE